MSPLWDTFSGSLRSTEYSSTLEAAAVPDRSNLTVCPHKRVWRLAARCPDCADAKGRQAIDRVEWCGHTCQKLLGLAAACF